MTKTEIRSFNTPQPKIEGNTLYGTAIPYNSLSRDLGGFKEQFTRGAVNSSIDEGLIEACLYHDRSLVIGTQAAGTLRIKEDESGVHYEVDLPDTSYVRDFRALMSNERKDVGGTSFGFAPLKGGESWAKEDGSVIRTISNAVIDHISPVITPAYPATSVALRSYAQGDLKADDLYGLDLDKLAQIFVSINRGLALDGDELELAQIAMGQLRNAIPKPRLKAAAEMASKMLL